MPNLKVGHSGEQLPSTSTKCAACGCRTSKAESDWAELIAELHGLLESYAPCWYTQELYERTHKTVNKLPPRRR